MQKCSSHSLLRRNKQSVLWKACDFHSASPKAATGMAAEVTPQLEGVSEPLELVHLNGLLRESDKLKHKRIRLLRLLKWDASRSGPE